MNPAACFVFTALVLLAPSLAAEPLEFLWRAAGERTLLRVVDPLPVVAGPGVLCPQPVAVYVVELPGDKAHRLASVIARASRAVYRENRLSLFGSQGEVLVVFTAATLEPGTPSNQQAGEALVAEVLGVAWYCPPEGKTPVAYAGELAQTLSDVDYDDDTLNTGGDRDCTSGGRGALSCSITCGSSSCSVGCEAGFYACCRCGLLSPSCTCRPR